MVFIAMAKLGKVKKETDQYDKRMVYGVSPKGFSDTEIMLEWITLCLKPYILENGGGPNSGKITVVMMDNYKAHLTKPTRNAMAELGVVFIQLPPNCTSVVQILDVGVNKPFKDYYSWQRDQWMLNYINSNSSYIVPGVSSAQCAEWASDAWDEVRSDTIVNTARKIGFFNQL